MTHTNGCFKHESFQLGDGIGSLCVNLEIMVAGIHSNFERERLSNDSFLGDILQFLKNCFGGGDVLWGREAVGGDFIFMPQLIVAQLQ